jgi:hypothetical protein
MSKGVKAFKSVTPLQAPVPSRSQGLPIVSPHTIDAIQHVYAGKKWGKQLTEYKDRLLQENPHLVRFIENQVSQYPRSLHAAMFEVVIGTLTVLEHQALVDTSDTSLHDTHRL